MQVNKPEQFEFVLDYVDCSFKFKDLRRIVDMNNFAMLKAYINTLKYQSDLTDDIIAIYEWNKRATKSEIFEMQLGENQRITIHRMKGKFKFHYQLNSQQSIEIYCFKLDFKFQLQNHL